MVPAFLPAASYHPAALGMGVQLASCLSPALTGLATKITSSSLWPVSLFASSFCRWEQLRVALLCRGGSVNE